jgi:hypothetical protein
MSRLANLRLAALGCAIGALMTGGLTGAQAGTVSSTTDYNLTSCEGSSYCGPAGTNYGTVDVTLSGNSSSNYTSATIVYTLSNSFGFIADPQVGDASATLQLTGNVNSLSGSGTGSWYPVTSGWPSYNLESAQIDHDEGSGAPGYDFGVFSYGLTCFSDSGTCGDTLTVTVTGSNLGLGLNSNNLFAALDTCDDDRTCGTQGAVAAGLSATPLPGALPLFTGGLSLFGGFGFFRKRKNAAAGAVV